MQFLTKLSQNSQIIIIHPHYRYHRYLLASLLKLGNPLYLRLDDYESSSFAQFYHCDFIILDEFDRQPEEAGHLILDKLMAAHPQKSLVIFSRSLPKLSAEQRLQACIFPTDTKLGLIDFYQETKTVVEFFGFGMGGLAINGKRYEAALDNRQKNLIFYLLEHGRCSRNDLLCLFWPESKPHVAIKALHNLKLRLHETLGLELISFQSGFYQINPSFELIYDAKIYRQLIDLAYLTTAKLAAMYFAHAHDIYKGHYLQNCDWPWARQLRQDFLKMQADIEAHLGKYYAAQCQKEAASTWYSLAFKHNPLRDDVLSALMKLFFELEMMEHARTFFEQYRELLQTKHGITVVSNFDEYVKMLS